MNFGFSPLAFLTAMTIAIAMVGCDQADSASTDADPPQGELEVAATADPEGDYTPDAELPVSELEEVDAEALQALIQKSADDNRITVIDYWATWCAPCVAMFPDLHEGGHALGDDVRMVSVTLDDPGEYERAAIRFLDQHDALTDAYRIHPTGSEQSRIADELTDSWSDLVVPAIFVYDRDGQLAGEFINQNARTELILERVEELLDEPAPAAE